VIAASVTSNTRDYLDSDLTPEVWWGCYRTAQGIVNVDYVETGIDHYTPYPNFTYEYDYLETPSSIATPLGVNPYSTYELPITGTGWSFVSNPLDVSGDCELIIDDARWGDGGTTWDYILWYDPRDTTDHWKSFNKNFPKPGDMPDMNNSMGFWIYITSNGGDASLSMGTGDYPTSSTVHFYQGWNLVGYPTNTPKTVNEAFMGMIEIDRIAIWNNTQPYDIQDILPTSDEVMTSGNAYWVHTTVDTIWIVDW
jgi:hypothetical protein